jgi:hypothetical protein
LGIIYIFLTFFFFGTQTQKPMALKFFPWHSLEKPLNKHSFMSEKLDLIGKLYPHQHNIFPNNNKQALD